MKVTFWILLFVVFYTYAGYVVLLTVVVFLKKMFRGRKNPPHIESTDLPLVCMFVAAYNERNCVEAKVANLLELDYPKDRIQFLWITDGSNDGTPELLMNYPGMEVHHQSVRRGKIHAMNRGMGFVKAPIVIFSDSNTILCQQAIRVIVKTFGDPMVGCVAGEKRTMV